MALAAAAAPKTVPASQFAELLRRSKFASYDPAIRQTYQASPANAHRGDWGVKRPISLRRRNAFISLTSFEHHAHFTEWNHAENQVRFIRRIEEMGGKVMMNRSTPWFKSMGIARSMPPLDSDFCPGESPEIVLESKPPSVTTETVNLDYLGKRGRGAYGSQRKEPPRLESQKEVFVTRNIHAMSNREFKRYLRSLRAQRPDFQKFVNAEQSIDNKDLYELAMDKNNLYYRRFLQSQMQKEYADYDGQMIQPQPHPNGAAQYAQPTRLEALLWTKEKPGFYLNNLPDISQAGVKRESIVSFGGLTTRVNNSVVVGRKMLLDKTTDQGVQLEDIEESVLRLRVEPAKGMLINRLPCTVGKRPQGLKAIKFTLELIKGDSLQMGWSNPHRLGSADYVAMPPTDRNSWVKTYTPPPTHFDGKRTEDTSDLLTTLATTISGNQRGKEREEL